MVEFYSSIPHNEDLEILKKQLNSFDEKSIPIEDLVKMAELVLKNNYFEFNSNIKHEISETAIRIKFAHHMHVYIWTTQRINFSKMNKFSFGFGSVTPPVFFNWTASESELDDFLE